MATMKAVRIHAYGGPEVLVYETVPVPEIAADEVLIRVHAAGVNPVDWKIRGGYRKEMLGHKLPLVLGWDVSGVIEKTGPAVKQFKAGDAVYGRIDLGRDGAYAEYVAAKAAHVALKPKSLDHVHAAGVALAALTAWQALFDGAHLEKGQTILVHAAAGGVGHFAVQLAKWKGARVIGTSSSRHESLLRGLGVDEMIDYEKTRFENAVSNVDVVLDPMAGKVQQLSWKVLKKGGILVSILGDPPQDVARKHGVRALGVFVQPNAAELTEIAGLIDAGKLKVTVEKVFPLSQARQAQELSETGHTGGKIVLKVRD